MSAPGQMLVMPLVGATDPRFLVLRRCIEREGARLRAVARSLPPADMRPLCAPERHLRLLP
ncbi:MAG: hypothetical protein QNJ98_06535 [Planctomycetota bacterium]|nr:hypothetical protein [Planctomycetota bacterium]